MDELQIYLAGDSTVCTYGKERAPQAGWGQMFPRYLKPGAVCINHAVGGRSSKSFINEGRLKAIANELKPDDYLLIQFGHNDSKPEHERRTHPFITYQDYLKQYISFARQKLANPVLVTPVQRRYFSENGRVKDTHGDYPIAVRKLATSESVPLIDLTKDTTVLLEGLGPEISKKLFMWIEPGVSHSYPYGLKDNTHFNEQGADKVAGLVCDKIKKLQLPLADFLA
ncbi:rhamnogalacturonan acetylesterase [Virgibacillus senegalensis]|uniref:rhamnogalacturonan acetylesterase n=1 Tax=Virgibacillus senegalensis TaxID=1499679 RepID=UPI00069D0B59|nr:rhamnogalacturonan acetylesterase [Virgibacillus senegalensis]